MTISAPIISAQGGTDAELQYQNVEVTPSATAAIVFLNTAAAAVNPFWQGDAIEILPARLPVEPNSGIAVMHSTTDSGIDIVFSRQGDINTINTKYRVDILFGVTMLQPEMAGILLFSQP